ncbi:MAG: helix-turn-helix transcriptional regulator [Calditrichia bacterium]
MNVSIDILGIIYILGVIQGFLLTILLFSKYRKSEANIILAWLVLLYSVFIVQVLLFRVPEIVVNYPHLLLLFDGLPFLFGPLHLIYVGKLTDTRLKFAQPHWFHFVPFIVFKLYYLRIFLLSKEELYAVILQVQQNMRPLHLTISGMLVAVQGMVYVITALYVFKEYSNKIKFTFSSLEKINLSWLRYFTILALIVWSIEFVDDVLRIGGIDLHSLTVLVPLLTSLFVYAIGYIGMFKTEIFLQSEISDNIHDAKDLAAGIVETESPGTADRKYQKSGLTEEKANEYLEKLKSLMEHERLYMNPELTLRDLSANLGTSTHNISEVINTNLNQNFFDFINHYRVGKVKEDLLNSKKDHLTLFGIAVEAGFNSKSGFNAIFKRYTGQTPSEYRNNIKQRGKRR